MIAKHHEPRFAALLHANRGIVFKVAGLYSRNSADRDDLMQEISAQLWRAFGSYSETKGKFATWMYRIALNVAISQARRQPWSEADRLEPLQRHHLETVAGAEPADEPDERLVALYAFIGRLDALNRALILLYLEDHSYAEIAAILGISETNVATKISRIKSTLRGQMVTPPTDKARV